MKICIIGGTGQLGNELNNVFKNKNIISLGKKQMDITNLDETNNILKSIKPDWLIHTAAFTNVDKCEERQEIAYQVNTMGTANVAKVASELKSKLIYISSDYVFDGEKGSPYHEEDQQNPINVYGKSKYLGELEVMKNLKTYYIVRTSWLYGFRGNNFVQTILNLTNHNTLISAVNDQRGCPTFTYDLAQALEILVDKEEGHGIYHLVNNDSCTWYDFAEEICRIKKINAKVIPIKTEEIRRKAPRPRNSSLQNNSSIKLRHWKEALNQFLRDYQ
ncbi:dTDP-4-dehydrorhamnose reductase [Alkaliphilus peptidifermentans]|uniref:dTDP-4-dehydrorhamnose reductase n=1 Tax=Alkaliphilus peptidifermentans DSM 18978 TaxID=1120976 RepID=A0A1G5H2P3_9FIRM|nr:dTDP-4-dehydrorhamnose reductase [Alkaliphilus peptidifermentans]SCY58125.1 dTDP-4-dehydrorhamnose reductase [Alkaliphilus peptidifermentans DSM 18978]